MFYQNAIPATDTHSQPPTSTLKLHSSSEDDDSSVTTDSASSEEETLNTALDRLALSIDQGFKF
jgi:hypothetical protein